MPAPSPQPPSAPVDAPPRDIPDAAVRFALNGRPVALTGRDALLPLSTLLRDRLGLTGTKVVCAEGDCGACTVLLGRPTHAGTPDDKAATNGHAAKASVAFDYRPVDACILFAFQCHGSHVVTVEGLQPKHEARKPNAEERNDDAADHVPNDRTPLTVLQSALVTGHGSQCGFCTPGIVMALHALREDDTSFEHDNLRHALSGNLCRCTGYQQILDACAALDPETITKLRSVYDETRLITQLQQARGHGVTLPADVPIHAVPSDTTEAKPDAGWLDDASLPTRRVTLHLPATLADALRIKQDHPEALPVAGATDVGVWHNHDTPWPDHVLGVTGLPELTACRETDDALVLGGGASWEAVSSSVAPHFPGFVDILDRFGSPQIRQLGTLAGNIANGSPIADSLPLLFAVDATVEAASHERGQRMIPITAFYTGYKQHVLKPDELITAVRLPKLTPHDRLHLEKVSKRRDMDISTFTAAIRLTVNDADATIERAAVALGGVAATVVRLPYTEQQLVGQPFSEITLRAAGRAARDEITPISDVRGSAAFRHQLAENVFAKAWHTCQITRSR